MIALFRRFTSLDRSQRRSVLEAAMVMAFVWAGLRLFRYLTLRRILDYYVARTAANVSTPDPGAIDSTRWAITAVMRHFPSATCLVQALAADVMLRRRNLASEVQFGVRRSSDSAAPIEGHAWVECADGVTIDAIDHQSEFKVLRR